MESAWFYLPQKCLANSHTWNVVPSSIIWGHGIEWLLSERLIFVLTHWASMHPKLCLAILIAVTPFTSTSVADICNTTWLLGQWKNMQELPFLVRFYTLTVSVYTLNLLKLWPFHVLGPWPWPRACCSHVVMCLELQKQTAPMPQYIPCKRIQTSGPKWFSSWSQKLPKVC